MERTTEPMKAPSMAVIVSDLSPQMTLAEYGKARRGRASGRHSLRRYVRRGVR